MSVLVGEKIYINKSGVSGLSEAVVIESSDESISCDEVKNSEGFDVPLEQGEILKCFVWKDGKRQSFDATVLSVEDRVVLSAPKEFKDAGVRKWDRRQVEQLVVFFKLKARDDYYIGNTLNISASGAQFRTGKRMNTGDQVAFGVMLGGHYVLTVAEIVRMELSKKGYYVLAVEFLNTEDERKIVDEYIKLEIKEQRRKEKVKK